MDVTHTKKWLFKPTEHDEIQIRTNHFFFLVKSQLLHQEVSPPTERRYQQASGEKWSTDQMTPFEFCAHAIVTANLLSKSDIPTIFLKITNTLYYETVSEQWVNKIEKMPHHETFWENWIYTPLHQHPFLNIHVFLLKFLEKLIQYLQLTFSWTLPEQVLLGC